MTKEETELRKLYRKELDFSNPDQALWKLVVESYNLALIHASNEAEVIWIDNPKLSDPAHITAIIDKQSILKLKIK